MVRAAEHITLEQQATSHRDHLEDRPVGRYGRDRDERQAESWPSESPQVEPRSFERHKDPQQRQESVSQKQSADRLRLSHGEPTRRGQPMRGLDVLKQFVAEHGWERVTRRTLADGFHLGHWVSVRRTDYKRGLLPERMIKALEAIPGWTWDPVEDRYRRYVKLLRQFCEQHGVEKFNARTMVDGVRLGAWATCRRVDQREGRLPKWLEDEFAKIPGWTWSAKDDFHREALDLTKQFVEQHGWSKFRSRTMVNGVSIGAWLTRRRADYRSGRLPKWLKQELESIPGFEWNVKRRRGRKPAGAEG